MEISPQNGGLIQSNTPHKQYQVDILKIVFLNSLLPSVTQRSGGESSKTLNRKKATAVIECGIYTELGWKWNGNFSI